MKRFPFRGVPAVLLALLLTGCSSEALMEQGVGLLDKLFTGDSVRPITSSPNPDPKPEQAATPEPVPEPGTSAGAEEPDFIDEPLEPAIPDGTASPPAAEPEPAEPDTAAAASAGDVTPSHTDVTLFNPGESFRFLPKGVTGAYACEYESGNAKVASVDSSTGTVTAVGPGTTTVKMHVESSGQYDFECVVRCSWKEKEKEQEKDKETEKDKEKEKEKDKESEKDKETEKSNGGSASGTTDDEPVLPPSSHDDSEPSGSSGGNTSAGVTASHSDATFFNPKEHFRFLPKGAGDDCTVTYSTSDADVASVDSKTGTVTAVGPGSATVTMVVDCGGSEYTFECIVRCNW